MRLTGGLPNVKCVVGTYRGYRALCWMKDGLLFGLVADEGEGARGVGGEGILGLTKDDRQGKEGKRAKKTEPFRGGLPPCIGLQV